MSYVKVSTFLAKKDSVGYRCVSALFFVAVNAKLVVGVFLVKISEELRKLRRLIQTFH